MNMNKRHNKYIVCLTGDNGVGKTTISQYCAQLFREAPLGTSSSYHILEFAQALKNIACELSGLDYDDFDKQSLKNSFITSERAEALHKFFREPKNGITPRELLIEIAKDCKNLYGQSVFADIVRSKIIAELQKRPQYFIVPDLRFNSEYVSLNHLAVSRNKTHSETEQWHLVIVAVTNSSLHPEPEITFEKCVDNQYKKYQLNLKADENSLHSSLSVPIKGIFYNPITGCHAPTDDAELKNATRRMLYSVTEFRKDIDELPF